MASDKKSSKAPGKGGLSNEEIMTGFQILRNEQRAMANKLSEMETELNEHKIVFDTLKSVDPKRRCYRMVGGILCERTVEEVMPTLASNKEQLTIFIDTLNDQLTKKGTEINEFKEKHNIQIRGREEVLQEEEVLKDAKRSAVVVDPVHA